MQTRPYSELFDLIKSLAGVNEFTSEETNYILNFAKRRLNQAFDAYDFWPRYLVAGEARAVDANGVISGASLLNMRNGSSSSVFVTYKEEVPELVNTSLIPLEFFYFMAHIVYADFLRMDGQTEKAIIEEQIGAQYLDTELSKASITSNTNIVGKRISTYVNRQSR